ncbi:MAG: hypothetical protein U1F56_04230 [Rubrivivax sp.]
MNSPRNRDDFFGICGIAAALILALALGVPALMGQPADELIVVRQAPAMMASGPARSAAEAVMRTLAQLLQPDNASAYGG